MVKVNFNESYKDYAGKEIKDNVGKVQMIKDSVCKCLYSSGEGITSEEKYEAYKLMMRIIPSAGEMDIEDTESVLIKKICDKTLTSGAYGQIVELLKGSK